MSKEEDVASSQPETGIDLVVISQEIELVKAGRTLVGRTQWCLQLA
jgi:hypothetical protein